MYQIIDGNENKIDIASKIIDGEHYTLHCTTPNGAVDNYISEYAHDPSDGDNEDANKDYSTVPAYFHILPPAGEVWYVARLITYIEDGGSFDSGGYGNGSALTNGIEMGIYEGEVKQIALTNSQPIKQNTHWKKFCYDIAISTFGSGNESLGSRWTFTNGGTFIRLDGDLNQSIRVEVSDDLSNLVSQTFLFQGYKES